MEFAEFKSASKIARTTVVLLSLTVVLDFLFTVFQLINIIYFDGLASIWDETVNTEGIFASIANQLSVALMLVSYSTNIAFLFWQFRAAKNLRAINANASTFTPGWHVGWWFVPFASLIMPLRCISELANGSKPENAMDPTYIANQSPTNLTGFWWFFYIFSTIIAIANMVFAMSLSTKPENWQYYTISLGLFEGLYLITGILAIIIVRNIDYDQEASYKLIGSRVDYLNPPPPPVFENETNY